MINYNKYLLITTKIIILYKLSSKLRLIFNQYRCIQLYNMFKVTTLSCHVRCSWYMRTYESPHFFLPSFSPGEIVMTLLTFTGIKSRHHWRILPDVFPLIHWKREKIIFFSKLNKIAKIFKVIDFHTLFLFSVLAIRLGFTSNC